MRTLSTKHLLFVLVLVICLPLHAKLNLEKELSFVQKEIPSAQLVNTTRLNFIFWSIYDISLFAPSGEWRQFKPFALSINYLRNFSGKDIADRTIVELKAQGYTDQNKLDEWYPKLLSWFPDVGPGVNLTAFRTQQKTVKLYQNQTKFLGEFDDPEFTQLFFDIWLGIKTTEPELRARLLKRR